MISDLILLGIGSGILGYNIHGETFKGFFTALGIFLIGGTFL